MSRLIVALNEPEGHRDFIVYAKHIAQSLADVSLFPSPDPTLAVFQSDIAALEAAEVVVLSRLRGAAADRDHKRSIVRGDLDRLRCYVETLASTLPRPEGIELVACSGLSVKGSSGHGKADFAAKQGPVSGSVHLVARAEKTRASYDWQYSLDGVSWVSVDDTVRADAWIRGLEASRIYFFQYRATTKAGRGDWSRVISLVVT